MNILHIIHSLNPAHGGTTYGLRGLVEELLRLGHDTEILVLDEPDSGWLVDWPCHVHALGSGWGNYGFNAKFMIRAMDLVPGFDHVLVHGLWQFHGFAARLACRAAGIPYSVFPHGMLDGWFAGAYPKKHRLKKCYWRIFEHRLLRDAASVFFTTEEEWQSGRGTFSPFTARPAYAAFGVAGPQGDVEAFRMGQGRRLPELQGKRVLLFLGRIHPKKGCDLMIQAGAEWLMSRTPKENPPWHLRLVGPCEDKSYLDCLRAQARDSGLLEAGLISFAGPVSGEGKWQELCAADALVLPSHQENFGVVVAEALACGTPVLISRKVNGWLAIQEAGAALVEADDLEGTRKLFARWEALTPPQIQRMTGAARAFFARRMSAEVSASALLKELGKSTQLKTVPHATA